MAAYITTADYREWYEHVAGGTSAGATALDEDTLELLLEAASRAVDEHCRRSWVPVVETRVFWPSWATGTRLVVGVAEDPTAVSVDGTALNAEEWTLADAGGSGGVAVLIRRRGRWTPPSRVELAAKYDSGTIPENVDLAICLITTRWRWSAKAPAGPVALLEAGVTPMRSWRDPDIVMLLERYVADVGR